MDNVIDYNLESELKSYLSYRRTCFNNYVQYIPNDDYDRIINARYSKVSRIKKRIFYVFTHRMYLYFCTFTFDDSLINKCDRTKKDLIKHSLMTIDDDVLIVLNKDYGRKTEREHYHCLIGTNNSIDVLNLLKSVYPCRFNVERVSKGSNDVKKVSKYINKLTNHCIKDSTKKSRLYFNFKGYDNLDPYFYVLDKTTYLLQRHTFPC